MTEKHRHRYVFVKDSPNAYTSHRECKICGHDPWMAAYNKNVEKQNKKKKVKNV